MQTYLGSHTKSGPEQLSPLTGPSRHHGDPHMIADKSAAEVARSWVRQGRCPIPVGYKQKAPIFPDWQQPITPADAAWRDGKLGDESH